MPLVLYDRSVCWVINGHYSMWPVSNADENANIIGYSGLVGGLLFEIGAYLAVMVVVVSLLAQKWSVACLSCVRCLGILSVPRHNRRCLTNRN